MNFYFDECLNAMNFNMFSKAKFLIFTSVLIFLCPGLFSQKPTVIVISLDGFRWDYPDKTHLPVFDSLQRVGVRAESLKPAFPSLTFPNHYTMATGLYPDHHGIVANKFYDPETDRHYRIGDRTAVEDAGFYGGEPIWVTAEKQGVTTASYYWVGSEAPIKGIHPTYWKKYAEKVPFQARVDTVIQWLKLPEGKRPGLVMFYYHEPDGTGHQHGPDSKDLLNVIKVLDHELGFFLRKLKSLPCGDQINLIVSSDHGMQPTGNDHVITLTDYIETSWFDQIEGSNPVFLFDINDRYEDKAISKLRNIPHTAAYRHGEVPSRLNYGNNPRTLDMILVADSGWTIRHHPEYPVSKGAHGYDPDNKNMHAIFFAAGPAFKEGFRCGSFENVDLYPLIAHLLGIVPASMDGQFDRVIEILKD
jgi:alkaline phosphatase D